MSRRINIVTLCSISVAMSVISACAQTPAAPVLAGTTSPTQTRAERQERVPGEYLVTLTTGANEDVIRGHFQRFGIKQVRSLGAQLFQLSLTNDPGPQAIEAEIRSDTRIKAIQPNFIYHTN